MFNNNGGWCSLYINFLNSDGMAWMAWMAWMASSNGWEVQCEIFVRHSLLNLLMQINLIMRMHGWVLGKGKERVKTVSVLIGRRKEEGVNRTLELWDYETSVDQWYTFIVFIIDTLVHWSCLNILLVVVPVLVLVFPFQKKVPYLT